MGSAHDRISELPDTIRLQILCLLPRKSAIRTSVLSWRWRELWRFRFPYATDVVFGEEFGRGFSPEEFVTTVDQFLRLRGNKKVDIFHLSFRPGNQHRSVAVSWIEYAIGNGVEELYLDFCQLGAGEGDGFQMPSCLFHVESLTVLYLRCCEFGPPVSFRKLKYLEALTLQHVNVTDDMIVDVVANCPFLERLELRQCPQLRSVQISGRDLRLKSLVVVNCWKACEMEIVAPSLRSFHFNGEFMEKYVFGDVSALSDAMMSSLGREPGICRANWVEIVEDLAHVRVLTLCSRAVQQIAVSKQSTAMMTLGNLRELQILMDLVTETNLSDIHVFFTKCHAPKLEKIFIQLPTGTKSASLTMFLEAPSEEPPSDCDFSGLKAVKINNFKGYKNEIELVRFFLENAPALETMILVALQEPDAAFWSSYGPVMQLDFLKTVSAANAKIVVFADSQDSSGLFPTHYDVYCTV